TSAQLQALLTAQLSGKVERDGIAPVENGVMVQFRRQEEGQSVEPAEAERLIKEETALYVEASADRMQAARIQSIREEGKAAFDIITTETARSLVAEALMASSLNDLLEVTQAIQADLVTNPERAPDGIFPITRDDEVLADVIGGTARD